MRTPLIALSNMVVQIRSSEEILLHTMSSAIITVLKDAVFLSSTEPTIENQITVHEEAEKKEKKKKN